MASYLQQKFPGRLNFTIGNSLTSVRSYFNAKRSLTCDIISVDGGHGGNVPLKDIQNLAKVASQPHNVIFVDDLNIRAVRNAWRVATKSGIVKGLFVFGCSFKSFAVGTVPQQKPLSLT